jgi:uncharacterized repeat protein (TIGR01451 family)
VALSGCGIGKSDEWAVQADVIGDVVVSTRFCITGDDDVSAGACTPYGKEHRGQALVSYRTPAGSEPPASFDDSGQRLHFERSASYSEWLEQNYAGFGMHWTGYVSSPYTVAPDVKSSFTVAVRLPLPDAGEGEPFSGPLPYTVEGGYRELVDPDDDGSAPVDCTALATTDCARTGLPRPGADSLQPTRDLVVLPGGAQPVIAAGRHGMVPFKLRFAGAAGAEFPLSASTELDGARVSLEHESIAPDADSDTRVDVDVAVPAGTPGGTYTVALTASAHSEDGGIVVTRRRAKVVAQEGERRVGTMTFRVPGPPAHPDPAVAAAPEPEPRAPTVPAAAQPAAPEPPVAAVRSRARLRVWLSATPRRAHGGDHASYLVVARNASAVTARRTRVCQTLPGEVQFVQATRRVRFRGRRLCFGRARLGRGRSLVALVYVHVDTDARAGMAHAWATAAAANADSARARAGLRVLRRAAPPRRAPVTG